MNQVYKTEEVLGSMKLVKEFAQFNANHKDDIKRVYDKFLLDFCDTQSFTPSELKYYRLGLDTIVQIFANCEADTEAYLRQAEEANNKSVG
jgi:hypothetical protein